MLTISPSCCRSSTRFRQFGENAVAHDNVRIEFKGIARTTPPAIANNCETEASNRSWQNVIKSMAVA